MLFRQISFYVAVLGVFSALFLMRQLADKPPAPAPYADPPRSPYENTVAAVGLIEASRENIRIASPRPAIVTRVHVQVDDTVRSGEPLFQLDDREARARARSVEAQFAAAQARLQLRQTELEDRQDLLKRTELLRRDRVATEEELRRREFAVAAADAQVALARAEITTLEAQLEELKTELSILTVRAPREGRVLQANIREGEFAPAAALPEPLMVLGDIDRFQIRAEVDEQNAILVHPDQPAIATLKGHADLVLKLRFVRIEPYVIPKRNLTGDSLERVDTRVLQIIYEFDPPDFPVYVGQQVDVFIQRPDASRPSAINRRPVVSR